MYRYLSRKGFASNPYQSSAFKQLKSGSKTLGYYNINSLGDQKISKI